MAGKRPHGPALRRTLSILGNRLGLSDSSPRERRVELDLLNGVATGRHDASRMAGAVAREPVLLRVLLSLRSPLDNILRSHPDSRVERAILANIPRLSSIIPWLDRKAWPV